eukprot:SRR837773.12461.p1 GENE.SRR837773.12461~~SRR837773.12461.p1  ORF type:complete len:369 (+),score=53.12 SRR837773.12461:128-1108(+)
MVFAGMSLGLVLGPLVVLALNNGLSLSDNAVWRWSFGFGGIAAGMLAAMRYRHLQETTAFQRSASTSSSERSPSDAGLVGALHAMRWSLAGTAGSWFLYDIVTYGVGLFSTVIFPTAPGYDTAITSLKINLISGLGSLLAILISNKVQLKALQIAGLAIMGLCFLLLTSYHLGVGGGAQSIWALMVFGLMRAADNAGPGVTTFTVPGEIFPTRLRGTAHGISAAAGKLGAMVGTIAFPFMAQNMTMELIMAFMALVCFLTAAWSWVFIPAYGVAELEMIAAQNSSKAGIEQEAIAVQRVLYMDGCTSNKVELAGALPFAKENTRYA